MDLALPSMNAIIAGILFSAIGFGAFRYYKRTMHIPGIVIGVLLMIYPYFVGDGWPVWVIGVGLCAALYYFRE